MYILRNCIEWAHRVVFYIRDDKDNDSCCLRVNAINWHARRLHLPLV